MKTTELIVKSMTCQHCEKAVKDALKSMGIKEVNISPNIRIVEISTELDEQAIINRIEELGYDVVK